MAISALLGLQILSLLGYHLTFDAEMSNPTDMSQFTNAFANGNTTLWNNHEAENYTPFQRAVDPHTYTFSNGALLIRATPTPNGGLPYTSGMLDTAGIFSQSSGYFEIRAITPDAAGFWPAFWMLPNGAGYPEIDIMEQPNNSGTRTEYWTHTSTPTNSSGGFTNTGVNVGRGYHTYGFLWTANTIQYTFDGSFVGSPQQTPPSLAGLQMYLLANLAVGGQGSWPGPPPDGAKSFYSIDYIRAFSNDPAVPAVSQEPISSPDGANTLPVLYPPAPLTPAAIGSGADTLTLLMSEDQYLGVDAQFTISVDGVQQGGILSTSAMHSVGQTQAFTVLGNFGTQPHVVTVDFLNDASGTTGDRNVYVNGASINGTAILGSSLTEYADGPQSFNFMAGAPAPISIGSGPDLLRFSLSEDPGATNAQVLLSVDGVQQGAPQTVTAQHAEGQTQLFNVYGTFSTASHAETVTLLASTAGTGTGQSANLYVNGVTFNGAPGAVTTATLTQAGTAGFSTPGLDTLTIGLTEDSWRGDAKAQISIDGTVLGTPTITRANAAGKPETLKYSGYFGGPYQQHSVTVNFLNDLYTTPGHDRNLYVTGINFDGTSIAGFTALMRSGPVTFIAPAATATSTSTAPSGEFAAQAVRRRQSR